jgi:hypothetical protein
MTSTIDEKNAFAKALEVLEALPEKKFGAYRYSEKGCYCAVGAIMHHYGMDGLLNELGALTSEYEKEADTAIAKLETEINQYSTGVSLLSEIPMFVLEFLQEENDSYGGTRMNRYKAVVEAVKAQIKKLDSSKETW